jgi:hypothetical protein
MAMADPLTLSVVGAVVLTEGVKFLYAQAGEALKRLMERRRASGEPAPEADADDGARLPSLAFEAAGSTLRPNLEVVDGLEAELRQLRAAVADFAEGIDPVDPEDAAQLERIDALRQAMEAVYGQTLAFKGEPESRTGLDVVGEAKVQEVQGLVIGLRARNIDEGRVTGGIEAGRIGPGGVGIGLDVDTIGGSVPGGGHAQGGTPSATPDRRRSRPSDD